MKVLISIILILLPIYPVFSQNAADSQRYSYSSDPETRFLEAAENGDLTVLAESLKKGVDVNTETWDGVTALMYATAGRHSKCVKYLLEKGAKINKIPYNGNSALITAAKYGYSEIAEMLITDSTDVNIVDGHNATPLHYASLYNNDTIAFLLIRAGANINKLTTDSLSPVALAALNNSYESAYLLVDAGADVNRADKMGFTPLMLAAQSGSYSIVNLLINAGANLNALNKKRYSALSFASINGYADIVSLLLRNGANPSVQSTLSINTRTLARLSKDKATLDTLRQFPIKPNPLPSFHGFGIGLGFDFAPNDLFTSLFISQRDIKYGLTYNLGFTIRPVPKQLQVPIPDFGYYQFWERRAAVFFDLSKNIRLKKTTDSEFGISLGGRLNYSWGHYRGTEIPIEGGLNVAPLGWFYYRMGIVETRLGYQYKNFGIKDFSHTHITLDLVFHFRSEDKFNINRKIKWIE